MTDIRLLSLDLTLLDFWFAVLLCWPILSVLGHFLMHLRNIVVPVEARQIGVHHNFFIEPCTLSTGTLALTHLQFVLSAVNFYYT